MKFAPVLPGCQLDIDRPEGAPLTEENADIAGAVFIRRYEAPFCALCCGSVEKLEYVEKLSIRVAEVQIIDVQAGKGAIGILNSQRSDEAQQPRNLTLATPGSRSVKSARRSARSLRRWI